MDNIEEEGIKKFNELRQKAAQKVQAKNVSVFSANAISEFARGFDILIFGYMSFLKKNTLHRSIQCTSSCVQMNQHNITDSHSYTDFSAELNNITQPVAVDFTFTLTNDDIGLGDISEVFSVYFNANDYDLVYTYRENGTEKEFRLKKEYMNHIEPGETRELQNLIWTSILDKTAHKLD